MTSHSRSTSAVLLVALAGMGFAGCAHSPTAESRPSLIAGSERGRQIAARECASCHAIDARSESPLRSAPPFRDIGRRYNGISLAREFVAIGQMGHCQMPPTQISRAESDDLIALFESLGP